MRPNAATSRRTFASLMKTLPWPASPPVDLRIDSEAAPNDNEAASATESHNQGSARSQRDSVGLTSIMK